MSGRDSHRSDMSETHRVAVCTAIIIPPIRCAHHHHAWNKCCVHACCRPCGIWQKCQTGDYSRSSVIIMGDMNGRNEKWRHLYQLPALAEKSRGTRDSHGIAHFLAIISVLRIFDHSWITVHNRWRTNMTSDVSLLVIQFQSMDWIPIIVYFLN